ncbi:TPA: hypothetical protein ACTZ52_005418, partial [Bacillus cereus]
FPASLKRGDVLIINHTGTGMAGAILEWKVPNDGIYIIEAWGAQGGGGNGGKGARMRGEFNLKSNEILALLVGQAGGYGYNGSNSYEGGGGGGTFVINNNSPLLIAGGGGGESIYGTNKQVGYPGETARMSSLVSGGSGAEGESYGGRAGSGTGGTGGGGLSGDGIGGYGTPGKSYNSGASGGSGYNNLPINGGFGGGGGAGFSAGGGGGGYTGGGGGGNAAAYASGGGGSYNAGENQSNSPGVKTGHGLIQITFFGSANEPPTEPSLIKQPISKSMNLSNEIVPLEWTKSTDPEGNPITYEIDFYNGTAWASIAKNIIDTNYDCILPSVTTDKAQLRIRATDSENGVSEYALSNVFTVAKQLYVIKDGNTNKSYKNRNWEFI